MSYADFLADADAVRNWGEWLVDISWYSEDQSGVLHYSRHGTATPPSGTPSGYNNTLYYRRVLTAPTIKQSIWSQGKIGGHSTPTYGSLVLRNGDGGLDSFVGLNLIACSIWFCDRRDPANTSGLVYAGPVGKPKVSIGKVEIALIGNESQFNVPIAPRVYRGGNYMLEMFGDRTVSYGTPAALNITGSLTVETWLWLEAKPTGNPVVWGWVGGTTSPWKIRLLSTGALQIAGFISGAEQAKQSTATLSTLTPYHIAIVISGADVIFYIWNADTRALTTETYVNAFTSATRQGTSGGPVYALRTGSDATFKPWWDEMRVWNVARTEQEIEATRFSTINLVPASVVHYTKMDDGTGLNVVDSSATAASGTISGGGTSTWLPSMEGAPDLAGTTKPELWGRRYGIAPVLVEPLGVGTTGPSYQIAGGGAVQAISAIYEGGASITISSNAASYRAFLVAVPAAGQAITYLARGLFKLGSKPTLPISCDAQGYNDGVLVYVETASEIIQDIVARFLPAVQVDGASFAAFETATSSMLIGLYVRDSSTTIAQAIDYVANSVSGWWGFRRGASDMYAEQFTGPAASSDFDLDTSDIVSVDAMDNGTAAYEVIVQYRPNDVVHTEDQVAAAVKGTVGWQALTLPYLEEKSSNNDFKTLHPTGQLSRSVTITTGLARQQDAKALADLVLSYLADDTEAWAVVLRSTGRQISVGDTVTLTYINQAGVTRLGMTGTQKYMVLTTEDRRQRGEVMIEVWG
jgi:hypothetical protein